MKLTILWTALPAGFTSDGSKLRLSVLVSPRLDPQPEAASTTLDSFPAIRDWPSHDLGFGVVFTPGGSFEATREGPAPDAGKWGAIFPGSTPVEGFPFEDYSTRRVASYPLANVLDFLQRQYARAGVLSPNELPPIATLVQNGFTDIRTVEVLGEAGNFEVMDLRERRETELRALFGTKRALPPAPPVPPMDFFQAQSFLRPRSAGERTTPVPKPDFDFHKGLASLGDHPELLRLLGLVIDLTVPVDGQPASGTVQVVPSKPFESIDVSGRTRYVLDTATRRFAAAPFPGSDLAPGRLRLDTPQHRLVQVDTDGAALKAIEFANHLALRHAGWRRSMDSETTAGLPALRSGGVALVRTGRAQKQAGAFKKATDTNAALDPAAPPEFFADDLTRGYRVDVEDAGAWRSLCRRRAIYRFVRLQNLELPPVIGEGVVTAAMMQDADETKKDEVLLHEALFHWDGWSLVAPRLGMAVKKPQPLAPGEKPFEERLHNESGTPLELEIDVTTVDRSLPRLRFGRQYRLRARAVDLCGNSEPFDSPDASHASPPVTYRRFEPVEAPTLLLLTNEPLANLPGESAARLVIRSRNADETLDAIVSPEISSRAILPPRTSVTMVEQSGPLDTPTGVDASFATWDLLAKKDETVLPDAAPAAPAEVPYLPDPFAVGAALRSLPGAVSGATLMLSFETAPDWIRAKPFTISVVEDSGPPDWDAATRILTVKLPKATVAKVRLSALVTAPDLDRMAVWQWIAEEAFDAAEEGKLRAIALEGGHWMLTPFRELTLVHAVLQPLAPPEVKDLDPKKTLGATFAAVEGRVAVHAASTGKIDLVGTWTEPTGFGPPETHFRSGGGHAFEVAVHDPAASEVAWTAADGKRHEFGDTKYRRVQYTATATTRFRDYFPAAETADPAEISREALASFDVDVLNSARPAVPDLVYIIPTFEWTTGPDARGTSSRRRGGLRVYLRQPWFSSGAGELLGVVVWPNPSDGCSGPPSEQDPEKIEKLRRYSTQWGRDPIWRSGFVHTTPSVKCFTRAVTVEAGCSLEEDPHAMAVAAHAVGFDDERQLVFCDLDIDTGPSYFPFVRLALARYQPKSVQGAELSRVLLADFVQFAPDRLCWVAREPDNPDLLRIVVSGTGYQLNRSFPCTSAIEVRLERFLADLGWVPVSLQPVTLQNVQAVLTLAAWEGSMALPPSAPDARFRVIVEEWESFLEDVPDPSITENDPFGQGQQRRLVYADAVEIPSA
jgi:hypothetical protein